MKITKEMTNDLFKQITNLLASESFKERDLKYYVVVIKGGGFKLAKSSVKEPLLDTDSTKLLILRVWDAKDNRKLTYYKGRFHEDVLWQIMALHGNKG